MREMSFIMMRPRPFHMAAAAALTCTLACGGTAPQSDRKPEASASQPAAHPADRAGETPSSPAAGGAPAPPPPGAATAGAPSKPPDALSTPSPSSAATPSALPQATPAGRPRTDNLAALEMGGRIAFLSRDVGDNARINLLDGNPNTVWLAGTPFPQEVVVSFLNFDKALVGGVTLTTPPRGPIPTADKPNEPA